MNAYMLFAGHVAELSEQVGIEAEAHQLDGRLYALLRQVKLPPRAFNRETTDVLFIADHQYPLSAMDMFWTEADVLCDDGIVPEGAKWVESYLGRQWRRFSWHRRGPWHQQRNPLLDHYALMEARFAIERRQGQAA